MTVYAWLSGAWTATLWFFTFGVARNLFGLFPRERAGEITTALFPAYFTVGIALGLLATLALWLQRQTPRAKPALLLQVLALAALVAIPLFFQPAMVQHAPGTPDWARWHGVSMGLNLVALITAPLAFVLMLTKRHPRKNS